MSNREKKFSFKSPVDPGTGAPMFYLAAVPARDLDEADIDALSSDDYAAVKDAKMPDGKPLYAAAKSRKSKDDEPDDEDVAVDFDESNSAGEDVRDGDVVEVAPDNGA